jgi:hypothetical protein
LPCAKTQKSKSGSGKIDVESGKNTTPYLESGKKSGKFQKKLLFSKKILLAQKTHECQIVIIMNVICIVLEVGVEPKSTCTLTLHWLQDERGATLQVSLTVSHRGGQQRCALSRPYQLQQRFNTLHILICEGLHAYIPINSSRLVYCRLIRIMYSILVPVVPWAAVTVCAFAVICLSVHTAD